MNGLIMVSYLSEDNIGYIVRIMIRGDKQVKSWISIGKLVKSSLNYINVLLVIACVINELVLQCY